MVPPGTTDGPSWDQLEKSTENKRLFRQNNPFFGGPSWDHCSVIHTLTNRRGPLHVSIDSCTFNTTKLIFNVLVSDEISEWYIGHATIDHLVAKDYRSMVSVFSTGLKVVENMVQTPLIAPTAPASHQPSCSVLDQLPCMRGMQSELSFELIFSHPVATIVTDGAPVNKKALQTLRTSFPEVIGIICTAHGLNLLVKHLVNKTPWMKNILNQVLEVIKFFRNRTRPRKILAMAHSKQLLLPAPTRFCYAVLSLQSFLAAAQHLKDLASSDLVSPELLKPCQQEWIKLQTDLQRSGGVIVGAFLGGNIGLVQPVDLTLQNISCGVLTLGDQIMASAPGLEQPNGWKEDRGGNVDQEGDGAVARGGQDELGQGLAQKGHQVAVGILPAKGDGVGDDHVPKWVIRDRGR